jgi:YHS domain-containing protein
MELYCDNCDKHITDKDAYYSNRTTGLDFCSQECYQSYQQKQLEQEINQLALIEPVNYHLNHLQRQAAKIEYQITNLESQLEQVFVNITAQLQPSL